MQPAFRIALPVLLTAGLSACASAPTPRPHTSATPTPTGPVRHAVANLAAASGTLVSGRLLLATESGGVRIRGDIGGLQPGSSHGFHIHEKGDCSAVDASTAGGHFNPDSKPHGRAGMGTHHSGDADNLVADAHGVAHVDAFLRGVDLGAGSHDILGRAIIVHAAPDDYSSQPSGNAGARVACGVIRLVP
ncbi:MAG: superoxide dismutase family protein [Thermomonas sp.]|uniref:superoxide dismutase family protein n=1 Tax=Thermomonas sp. TaxID=1971895 RepID=UPI00261AB163|nr:superoxide dismutase family protein [Thermomonas sp.]MCC7096283.1 superoxide dismutase family protein [Thermomonas sp.]